MRPLQLNFLFLGPNRLIKVGNEMFFVHFKRSCVRSRAFVRWCRCIYCPSVSTKCGASLVTRRVVKANYGWMFGYLLYIANSLLSNAVVTHVVISKNEHLIDPVAT